MKLVYKNGREVRVGDQIQLFENVKAIMSYFTKPHKPSSEGKVTVVFNDGKQMEYYVSVIGAEWIEREDRQ